MVKEKKLKAVEELKKKLEKYPVIAILDMFKIPTKQLQEIVKALRGKATMKMIKKSIFLHALKEIENEIVKKLVEHIPQQPAIIFTEMEPFKFYALIDKLKSPAYAKGGDTAITDVRITAGPTSLMPGPVISELGKVGVPAGVEEGKISIKKDVTVARGGG